jgi:hypothetical protein
MIAMAIVTHRMGFTPGLLPGLYQFEGLRIVGGTREGVPYDQEPRL